ncbi:MAG: sortase [Aggregatilineales bacterium]
MNKYSRVINKAFSLLALICLALMQAIPISTAAAHPAFDQGHACGIGQTKLMTCFPDGSDPANLPGMIQVIPAGGGAAQNEAPNDGLGNANGGTSPSLKAHVGDTVQVPFEFADVGCSTIPIFAPTLNLNPTASNARTISPTAPINWGAGSAGLTQGSGLGPIGSANMAYGYFQFVVQATDGVPDSTLGNIELINLQLNSNQYTCNGIPPPNTIPNSQQNLNGVGIVGYSDVPGYSSRRVQIAGATFNFTEGTPAPTHVSQGNSVIIPVTVTNSGNAASFSLSTAVVPVPSGGNNPNIGVNYDPAISGTFNLGSGLSASGNVTVGPFPANYPPNVSITITATGTIAPDSSTKQLQVSLPVLSPQAALSVSSTSSDPTPALYKPGDTATYTVTLTNISNIILNTSTGWSLSSCTVVDSLGGLVTMSPTTIPPGQTGNTAKGTFTHVIMSNDPNPLTDSTTANCTGTPPSPDTGSAGVYASNTYSIPVESANLNVSLAVVTPPSTNPTPNYAKPGTPIAGTLSVINTGTQDITITSASAQLIDPNTSTVYGTAPITNLPGTVPAGVTVSPAPAFSITPTSIPGTVYGVNLVLTIDGISSQSVHIHRQIVFPMDVVTSALHVIVTTDAPSNVVVLGQTVKYSIAVQNISGAAVTGITISTPDSLGLLSPLPINIPSPLAPGATYTLPNSYNYTVTGNSPSPQLKETVTVNFSGGTAVGQSVLTYSNTQLFVGVTANCVEGTSSCTPIVNNQVQAGAKVRYTVLVQNVGPSVVNNVIACLGNASCKPGDPGYIPLTFPTGNPSGTLYSLGSPATNQQVDVTIPASQNGPFTQVVTVTGSDQLGATVIFRGTSTLVVVAPNLYLQVTKSASLTTAYVGDTITYNVQACYVPDPSLTNPPAQLNNLQAQDPFIAGNHFVSLAINNNPPSTSPQVLPKGQCAKGTYTYIPDGSLLAGQPGPVQLTNTVTFTADNNTAETATASVVISLLNPIKVTKTVSAAATVYSGDPITYNYTFTNLSSQTITGFSANDVPAGNGFQPALPPTLNAGQTVSASILTSAPGTSALGGVKATNVVTANGAIGTVTVTASATASIQVNPALTVTKSANPVAPFQYDPTVTYTVTITNNATVPITLTDANDSMQGLASPVVSKAGPFVVGGVNHTLPYALAPGAKAVLTYTASPAAILQAGTNPFTNTFTVNAQTPAPANSTFTATAQAIIAIFQPIGFSVCPQYTYYGWGETSHWTVVAFNGSDPNNPVSITGLTMGAPALNVPSFQFIAPATNPANLPTAGSTATAHFDYVIPWNSSLTSFDNVPINYDYYFTPPGGGAQVHISSSFTVSELGCAKRMIGPPLTVTKVPDKPNSSGVGDVITYTVTVSNPMQDPADTVSGISATDSTFGTLVTLSGQTLSPGQAPITGQIKHTITKSDPTPLINTVSVQGTFNGKPFPNALTAQATVLLPTPTLQLTLTTDKSTYNPGDPITYSLLIQNTSQNSVLLQTASANPDGVAPNDAATGFTNWLKTPAANGGILAAGASVPIANLYKINASTDLTKTGSFASTISVNYTVQTTPTTQGTSTATATVTILNPYLQITISASPQSVVNYGQSVTFTETVLNPEPLNGTAQADTNLVVTHTLLAPGDVVSHWFDKNNIDQGSGTPPTLPAGVAYHRLVTHNVTTADFTPLTFTVTATADFNPVSGPPIPIKTTQVYTLIISSAQLLMFANPQKTTVRAGDTDDITLTMTNIGPTSIDSLTLTATLNDPNNPSPVTIPTLPNIPGGASPGNQLTQFAAASADFTVAIPNPLPSNYPNQLIVTFAANGTAAGSKFNQVILTVLIHVLNNGNIQISEAPQVSAAPLGSTVNYNVTVFNTGTVPLNVSNVTDLTANKPVSLVFTSGGQPALTGTIPPSGTASGVTSAPITLVGGQVPNPFIHMTKATATAGAANVSDTSASTVNVLNGSLSVTYSAPSSQVPLNQPVTFTLTVTNVSQGALTNLLATDTDQNATVTLTNAQGQQVTTLAPGASATGLNVVPKSYFVTAGPVTSHVTVTAVDVNNNQVVANQSATVIAVGAGIAFASPPTPNVPSAAPGQTVTFSFTLKNTSMQATDDLTNVNVICQGTSHCLLMTPPLATLAHGTISPTESITYTVQPTDTGTVSLTFTASGIGGNPAVTVTANAIGQFNVAVGGLVLIKTANPTTGTPGAKIAYTVTLKNTNPSGNITVNGLVDTLMGDIKSLLTSTTIPAGGTVTATYTSNPIPITAPPTLTNTVTATFTVGSTQFTSTASANVTITPIGGGALQVSVIPSAATAAIGSSVTFAIVVSNTGTSDIDITSITSSLGVTTSVSNPLLPAGQTVTLVSSAYLIPAGATGAITNIITVNGQIAGGTTVQGTGSCSVTVIGAGGLSVTKTANVSTAAVGASVLYTIQVANYGAAPLTITGVADSLLGSQTSLNNVTLAPNALAPPIVVSRTILATDPQDVRNTVTVSAKDASANVYTATAFADVLVTSGSTALIIVGTPSQTVALPTDTLTYSVRVANILPPGSSTSVTINGITATATVPNSGNAPQSITLAQQVLTAGQETFGTFTFALGQLATLPNPFVLTLNASGQDPNGVQYTATSQTPPVAISTNGQFAALLTADQNSIPVVGGKINYTLTVTNVGANPLTGISAKINTSQSNLNAAGLPASPYGGLPATLSVGGSTAITFAYTVQSGDPTGGKSLVNATDVTGNSVTTTVTNTISTQVGPTVTNFAATCTPPSASCVVKPGDTLGLTATVADAGAGPLTNITYLLNGSPISPNPPGWPTSLVPGQTVNLSNYNYSVPTALPASDPVSLMLTVNATAGATPVTGSSNAITYTVINPVMTLTGGSTTSQPVPPGTTVNFSFTLTNTSTTITGPGGTAPTLVFVAVPASSGTPPIQLMVGTPGSSTLISVLPPASLTPGQPTTLTAQYIVKSTDPSTLPFTITAVGCPFTTCSQTSQTISKTQSGSLQTTNVTTPTPSPTPNGGGSGLTVTKTANASNVAGGQAVIFTMTVTNNTASLQTGVALTDTLPSTLTAGTATTSVGAATVTNSTLTVAIGTLTIGQAATITFNTTVGSSVSPPTTIVNSGCATTATITTAVCASATLTVGANASTLPVTGFGGNGPLDSGLLSGLLWIGLMLSSLLVFGLAAGRGSKRGGSSTQTLRLVIAAIVGMVVLVLLVSIVSSVINKARTAPAATQTQVAANATAVVVTKPSGSPVGPPTVTSIPPPTEAPTYTPAPTLPLQPRPTALPFQPVGERSFYMPRLQLDGAIPIVDLPLVNGTWDVNGLGHSVGHLQETSWVGPSGNTVLVAHIQLTATDFGPFLRLRQVQVGDIAYVADNGQIYKYQVTGTTTVDPTDVKVTYPTVDPELTLITCTGWDTYRGAFLKRFVVTAKLVGPASTPTSQPQT